MKIISPGKFFIIFFMVCAFINSCSSSSSDRPVTENENADIVIVNNVTASEVSLTCELPELKLANVQTPMGEFTRITSPHPSVKLISGGPSMVSRPEVPMAVFLIAFPIGATEADADIQITASGGEDHTGLVLYPVQKAKRDFYGVNDDESFSYSQDIYYASSTSHTDISLSKMTDNGRFNVWKVVVNLMDYDPVEQKGTMYTDIDVHVTFTGNTDYYVSKRIAIDSENNIRAIDPIDQWLDEEKNTQGKWDIKNASILAEAVYEKINHVITLVDAPNSRFLIITPPSFLAAAEKLRDHKVARGISTAVISTEDISGATAALTDVALRNYLVNAYNTWTIQPYWVLLMGDTEFIPTHYDSENNGYDGVPNAGDMFYGQINGVATELPVFGIGRLPVDTLNQADVIVDKIIAFETHPPSMYEDGEVILVTEMKRHPFYQKVTFAAEFQDVDDDHPVSDGRAVRWFAQVSEDILQFMKSEGFTTNRIFRGSSMPTVPQYWENGDPLPQQITWPGYDWMGDREDIIAAFNAGTSLIMHRDHGSPGGWGTPNFNKADLDSIVITENQYPVVYSINCASGFFDNETQLGLYGSNAEDVSWSEQFIRNENGAIGIICDTRCSDTVLNNYFALGLYDATWSELLPYGGTYRQRKLGDILNYAKGYIKAYGFDELAMRQEITIYNLLGDPTVELRACPPSSSQLGNREWIERAILDLPLVIDDPFNLKSQGTPIIAVAVEREANVVVGRTLVSSENIEQNMTIRIPIDTERLGSSNSVEVVISGSGILPQNTVMNFQQ